MKTCLALLPAVIVGMLLAMWTPKRKLPVSWAETGHPVPVNNGYQLVNENRVEGKYLIIDRALPTSGDLSCAELTVVDQHGDTFRIELEVADKDVDIILVISSIDLKFDQNGDIVEIDGYAKGRKVFSTKIPAPRKGNNVALFFNLSTESV